jgi:hypothetical protein
MAQQPMDMLPTELQEEQDALLRRQRIADMMTQRGQVPIQGGMAGRAYVGPSWTQGLAQLANAYLGGKTSDQIGAAKKDIAGRYNTMYADEIAKLSAMKSGSAPRPQAMSADDMAMIADQGGENAPTVQDVAPASRQQIMDAMLGSKIPALRNAGMAQMNAQFANDLKDDQVVVAPGGVVLKNGVPIYAAPNRAAPEKSFKVGDIRKMRVGRNDVTQEYQADGTWKEIAKGDIDKPASVTVAAPVTPVTIADPKDPNKTIVVDGRTGAKIGDGPKMTEAGKIDAKVAKQMEGFGADIQMAEDILKGIKRNPDGTVETVDKPTSSYLGSAIDVAGKVIGASPKGAAQAKSLAPVAARLVQRIPRFEGPQSDKDVQLYREAAADVANNKEPIENRLAALVTMKEIYAGYESGARGRLLSDTQKIRPAGTPAPAAADAPPPPPGFVTN